MSVSLAENKTIVSMKPVKNIARGRKRQILQKRSR